MMSVINRILLLLFLILAVGVTQYYVVGFEMHRFYAPSWFFLGVGVFLLFSGSTLREKGARWIYGCLLVLVGYIALRGVNSAVPGLTHKEFPLLFYGVISFLAAAHLARYRGFLLILGGAAVGLLVLQLIYSLVPADETDKLWKAWGERRGQNGRMFGLFRHYNPFASYCGLNAGVLAALLFMRFKNGAVTWGLRVCLIALSLFTLYGAFKSGSRMGTAVTAFSLFLALFGGLSLNFLIKDGKVASLNKLMLVIGIGVLGLCLSGGLFTTAFNKVSEARGKKGDITEDVMGGMRISAIGMGFSLWLREPVVGSGPRSYSYNSPSLRRTNSAYDKGNHGHPDAEMVHNDWIQVLAEYGVVGMVLALLTLGSVLLFTWRGAWAARGRDSSWFVAPVGATAAVAGIMVHSLGDFTMHSTPVFVYLSLILGGAYGWGNRVPEGAFTDEKNRGGFLMKAVLVLVSVGLFIYIGQKQITHNVLLVKYDHAKWKKDFPTYLEVSREAAEKAPDSFMLQELGYNLLRVANTQRGEERLATLEEAESVLERAVKLHPYRIEILANLGRAKMELGKLEEAETYISEAFKWTGERWKVYHLGQLAETFLIRKAGKYWSKRNAPAAMAYYLKAKLYNDQGFWRNHQGRGHVREKNKEQINKNLKVLEMGRVSPQEGIEFFNGYGLE